MDVGTCFATLHDFHEAALASSQNVKVLQHILNTRMIIVCATHRIPNSMRKKSRKRSADEEDDQDSDSGSSCPYVRALEEEERR